MGAETGCPHSGHCQTRAFWGGLNELINRYVDGVTLAQLASEADPL